ncbi:MAG: THUMP domain-containing protein [Candidatus Woesearchaeota archaeon]
MNALLWTHNGMEDVSAAEIKKAATNIRLDSPFVIFDVKSREDLAALCYHGRSFRGIMQLLLVCSLDELEAEIKSADFSLAKDRTFAVRAKNFGEETDLRSIEVLVGNAVDSKVNLDSPDVTFLVFVRDGKCYVGIDFAGLDLGKRDYKLFTARASLKGSLAFSMLKIAGFKPGMTLLDPCCREGTVGIEAALYSIDRSVHFFQKEKLAFAKFMSYDFKDKDKPNKSDIVLFDSLFHNVQSVRKNAKIADVADILQISRVDIDWVDTRFERSSVDVIASYPMQQSERTDQKLVSKFYRELFHQADYALKKRGKMILAMRSMKPLEDSPWKPKKVLQVSQGKEILSLVLFQK